MQQMTCMSQTHFMKHVITWASVSLLLLVYITGVQCEPIRINITPKIYPNRWDLPSPLEIHGTFSEPSTMESFSIAITSVLASGPTILMGGSEDGCYAVLDHSKTIPVTRVVAVPKNYLHFVLDDGNGRITTFERFYIQCPDVIISYPSIQPVTPHTSVTLTIEDSHVRGTTTFPIDMPQHPTIIHQYQWKSTDKAIVAVKFSFYRPSTMYDDAEFHLDHPLLQLKRITSPQLPLDTSYVEDLRRPYHLLKRDDYIEGIQCYSDDQPMVASKSWILFQRDPILDHVAPVTSLPTSANGALSEKPYICSFTIDYPADVIYASMYSLEDVNEELTASIRWKGGSDNERSLDIPLGVPPMIPYPSSSSSPSGVLIWRSPHHLHDNMMEFEMAIATTSVYHNGDVPTKINIIQSPFTQMTFQLTAVTTSSGSEWNPTINCRPHNSHDTGHTSHANGVINLTGKEFHGLGQICRIMLHKGPANALHRIAVSIGRTEDDVQDFTLVPMSLFDVFHISLFNVLDLSFHDTISINSHLLTWKHPSIPLTTYRDDTNRRTYIRATMNLQLFLPYRTPIDSPISYLILAFNKQSELLRVASDPVVPTTLRIHQGSSSYSIIDQATIMQQFSSTFHNVLPGGIDDPEYFAHNTSGEIPFQASRPLRAPFLIVHDRLQPPLLDHARPVRISLEWDLPDTITADDIDGIVVYPSLSPYTDIHMSTYTPHYARITPVRKTPLTGFSYRCVTWDRMAAAYAYDESDPAPLTPETTVPCPSRPQGAPAIDPYWRRIAYDDRNLGPTCFYELAAVCVTPSATVEGAYDVHPLADCPSFLGGVHALPCSLVDNDGDDDPSWNYTMSGLTVSVPPPQQGEEESIHTKRTLTLRWTYQGDSRRTLTLAIKPVLENNENDDDGDGDNTQVWITLAHDIPAYISPQPGYPGLTIGFPILSPLVKRVYIRLTLNGAPGLQDMVTIQHDPWELHQTACDSGVGKVFDDLTHLCKCADSLVASGPTSVDNPLVYPLDFSCEEKPQEQVPIDPEQCHTIPQGVTPPYRTQECGYGFATSNNGKCDECTCFNAWKKGTNDDENDGKKCERCVLMDVCVVKNTADITFKQPEYCLVERCLCKPGYSGDKCQYTVMYGTLTYHDVATEEQKSNPPLIAATKEKPVIVPRRQITTFQPRVANNVKISLDGTPVEAFVQQATQILSEDGEEVITSIMVALGRLTDTDVSPSPSPFMMVASPFTPAAASDLGDLHYAWEQLQNNYQDRPVYKDNDYGTLNGGVGSAYDPHCVPNAYTYCPDGKEDDLLPPESQVDEDELKNVYEEEGSNGPIIDDDDDDNSSSSNTTTYIIIGVVVGVVLLLFIALIVSILYCRKHDKMCFRKRKTKGSAVDDSRSVELASSKSNTATSSSAAPPSSTISTSSYLPTQVAIVDPTLPADWIALEDKSTGKIYYSNKVTMESSWDHPAKPKEDKNTNNAYGW